SLRPGVYRAGRWRLDGCPGLEGRAERTRLSGLVSVTSEAALVVLALTAVASPTSTVTATVAVIVVLALVLVAVVVAFALLFRFGGRAGRILLTDGVGAAGMVPAPAIAVVVVLVFVLVAVPVAAGRWLVVLLVAGRGRHQEGQAQDKRHNQGRNAGAQKSRSLHQLQEVSKSLERGWRGWRDGNRPRGGRLFEATICW